MSAHLSACPLAYLKNTSNFTTFSVYVTYGHGSVLLGWQCNTLCISGFVNDMFSHNGANGPELTTILWFAEFTRWQHRSDIRQHYDWLSWNQSGGKVTVHNCRLFYPAVSCVAHCPSVLPYNLKKTTHLTRSANST